MSADSVGRDPENTRPIEPEILQRLGLFIVRWAFVEVCVSDLFVLLTRGDPGSMLVVTSSISQSTISQWIRTLIETHQTPDEMAQEINDVLSEVDYLRSERNILAHGLWGTTGPEHSALVMTSKLARKEIIRDRVVTVSDLDGLIADCQHVMQRLLSLLKRIKPIP